MNNFQNVLILGTGPVAIQVAVNLKQHLHSVVAIAGRQSSRADHVYKALAQSDQHISVHIQNEKHQSVAGECRIDHVFAGYEQITGQWDTIVLAVTTDTYIQVLQQLQPDLLKQIQCVLLISPTFGSGDLVSDYISAFQLEAEIISFSTYYGDTRWADHEPSHQVITTAVKKKVYIGSQTSSSLRVQELQRMYQQLGIQVQTMSSPLEAETRNISLYVHPALFMNDFSLQVVFGSHSVPKFVYKLYPEGPITPPLIRNMLSQWKEVMNLLQQMGITGINLLQFMVDDNYPIATESLSREDIENFIDLEPIHQEYLLYVRYASLLIDPFSEPDSKGRYFDFSAVPIRTVFTNKEGKQDIPRMPQEDYYRIKMIQGFARHTGTPCPTIDQLIRNYEYHLQQYIEAHPEEPLSTAFQIHHHDEDYNRIQNRIQTTH